MDVIRIAAGVVVRPGGDTLLVRKRCTVAFMQPGGKIGLGESPLAALRRELVEELGLAVPAEVPRYLGRFSAPAANEAGCIVVADLFWIETAAVPHAAAEIEEIAWVDPRRTGSRHLAPLTRDVVLGLWGGRSGLR
jgi:8-oxo-dGTP pyrophosphatase MutT (NUDIX family)